MKSTGTPGTGVLAAHVADAIEAVTGNTDYDAVADEAAELVRRSQDVREAAGWYSAETWSWDEFRAAVEQALGEG